VKWRERFPCLGEDTPTTSFDQHYIYHTAWAARLLALIRPAEHIDISSSLYFAVLVSAFIPIQFYDYRPVDLHLSGLATERADLLNLPFPNQSIESLSCMHTVEHVGLGRYNDPIDPDGDLKAQVELQRVLAPGGSLLFVVPVGKPAIKFNAHRIYSYNQVLKAFPDLILQRFSLIPDMGGLIENADPDLIPKQQYGCGCFWFIRPGDRRA
jgi:SAM-dependent methyltransferase